MAAEIGISAGMAYRVAKHDYWPKDREIQERIYRALAYDYDAWRRENADQLDALLLEVL